MTTQPSDQVLAALRDEYQDKVSRVVNPDYYNGQAERDAKAFRWHQIGAHERIARRRNGRQWYALAPRGLYRGPEDATDDEREAAYQDIAKENPQWEK